MIVIKKKKKRLSKPKRGINISLKKSKLMPPKFKSRRKKRKRNQLHHGS
jgi:hypothetical protein